MRHRSRAVAPDLGDPEAEMQAYVDHLNANGGIAGRQIVATYHPFDATGLDDTHPACIAATQDVEPFVVVGLPAVSPVTADCIAVENATFLVDTNQDPPQSLLDEGGDLDGATVGVVYADGDPFLAEAIEGATIPALTEAGLEPAEIIELPCATASCEQHETAVEELQAAGVDTVFVALAALGGPAFVGVAAKSGFEPQRTVTNRSVNDTVAQLYEAEAEAFAGALGVGQSFQDNPGEEPTPPESQVECNRIYEEASDVRNEPGTDAFGLTALGCGALDVIRAAARSVEPDRLGWNTLAAGIAGVSEVPILAGVVGGFGRDEHDAADFMLVRVFDPDQVFWIWPDGEEPTRIPTL